MSEADFDSRWEFSKSTSNYHFDPTVDEDDNPPFKQLGRFEGDWSKELELIMGSQEAHPNSFLSRLGPDHKPYTDRLDAADLERMGLNPEWVLFDKYRVPVETERLRKMINHFGMHNVGCNIHVQRPGQSFFFHIDNLTSLRRNVNKAVIAKNPDAAARFGIALTDWVPGHVYAFGNTYWKQWRAGDVVWHDWINTPHGTANLSQIPRVTLQVTGMVTETTRRLLRDGLGNVKL